MANRRKKAILIGVTGQIGAGKSTVAKIFRSFGCTVISGDELGRQVLEQNRAVRKRLVNAFGDGILLSKGRINRKELAKRAFISDITRRKLNQIVHPPLLKELDRQVRSASRTRSVVIIDATLLIEWGYQKKTDKVVVVTAPRALRHLRLRARGIAPVDIFARERLQLTQKQFTAHASKVFRNSGDVVALKVQVATWLKKVMNRGVDSHR